MIDAISYTGTTADSLVPFTLDQAKKHTRIDIVDDDSVVIPDLMASATQAVEGYINRKLISQQWDIYWHGEKPLVAGILLKLPFRNVISIDLVESSVPGVTSPVQFVAGNDFSAYGDELIVRNGMPWLFWTDFSNPFVNGFNAGFGWDFYNWQTRYHVQATFGFGLTADSVPGDLIGACLELFAFYYDNRNGDITDPSQYRAANVGRLGIPLSVQSKLAPYRNIAI